MELNYKNTCVANEPQVRTQTVVEMTDELRLRIAKLLGAATRVTEGMIGEQIDLPDGGEGPLPDRAKWMMETLLRITEALTRVGGFLG